MTTAERKRFVLEPIAHDPEVGRWLAALEDARRDTIRELAGVTPQMLDWRPDAPLNSIGTLLYHIGLIETSWLLDDIFEGETGPDWVQSVLPFPDRDDDSGRLIQVDGEPIGTHLQRLSAIRTYLLERLRPMANDDFHRTRHLQSYDAAPDWVLHHLLQHEAEHRSHIAWLRDTYPAAT
jgi:DinB family protein